MLAWLAREGVVLQSRGSVFGEQVYLCVRGRRHPIVSASRLNELGFRWPIDLQPVSEKILASYAPAGGVPKPWSDAIDTAAIGDAMAFREALACGLSSFGLEIGAGASPFPVTTLEHLVEDHRDPRRDRDLAHYEEFCRQAQPVSQNHLADTIRQKFAECYAIHYHVWTHSAVAEKPQRIEFYAVLVK
ncbi:MAG: hypothetical protein WCJ21_12755 [Planctomycetota bacterium]